MSAAAQEKHDRLEARIEELEKRVSSERVDQFEKLAGLVRDLISDMDGSLSNPHPLGAIRDALRRLGFYVEPRMD